MSSNQFKLVMAAIPVACLLIGGFMINSGYHHLVRAQQEHAQAQAALNRAIDAKVLLAKVTNHSHFATVADNPSEESEFLSDLKQRVARSKAKIQSWTSSAQVYGPKPGSAVTVPGAPTGSAGGNNGGQTSGAPAVDPVLAGITRISSSLTLIGTYRSLRTFLGELTNADRLFTIQNVHWTRNDKGGTTLGITVSRYVAPLESEIPAAQDNTRSQISTQ